MFTPCQKHTCKYTLPCWRLKHFASVSSLLAFCTGRYCTKLMAHWSSLDFVVLLWSCVTKVLKCQLSPVFSSTNYSLQFQAFNLFWVTFEYSVRKRSDFFLLHVDIQLLPLCPEGTESSLCSLGSSVEINYPQIQVDSVLFYWPKYRFQFQHHTALIIETLWHI